MKLVTSEMAPEKSARHEVKWRPPLVAPGTAEVKWFLNRQQGLETKSEASLLLCRLTTSALLRAANGDVRPEARAAAPPLVMGARGIARRACELGGCSRGPAPVTRMLLRQCMFDMYYRRG